MTSMDAAHSWWRRHKRKSTLPLRFVLGALFTCRTGTLSEANNSLAVLWVVSSGVFSNRIGKFSLNLLALAYMIICCWYWAMLFPVSLFFLLVYDPMASSMSSVGTVRYTYRNKAHLLSCCEIVPIAPPCDPAELLMWFSWCFHHPTSHSNITEYLVGRVELGIN